MSSAPPATDDPDRVVIDLCALLAERVAGYRENPGARPAVTARWRRDMRLLVERGPLGRATPEPLGAERVRNCIEFVFTHLAAVDRKGFCWAAQVRSPHALREHWDQLLTAGRSRLAAEKAEEESRPSSVIARVLEEELAKERLARADAIDVEAVEREAVPA